MSDEPSLRQPVETEDLWVRRLYSCLREAEVRLWAMVGEGDDDAKPHLETIWAAYAATYFLSKKSRNDGS